MSDRAGWPMLADKIDGTPLVEDDKPSFDVDAIAKLAREREEAAEDAIAKLKPSGWRIMVEDYAPPDKTKGGVLLADVSKDNHGFMNYCGRVVKLGASAYQHPKFCGAEPWCREGDWVIFGRYAGQRVEIGGRSFRFVNDDEVLAVAGSPEDFRIYV